MDNLDRYIVMASFGGYVGKLLLLGATLADVGIVAVIAAAYFLFMYVANSKQIDQLKQELKKDNSELKNEVLRLQSIVDEHRTSLTSIKMSQGIRNVK